MAYVCPETCFKSMSAAFIPGLGFPRPHQGGQAGTFFFKTGYTGLNHLLYTAGPDTLAYFPMF